MIAGSIGICAWLNGLFQGVIWIVTLTSVSQETLEDMGSTLGILVGIPLSVALGRYLWTNPHDDLTIPGRMLAPNDAGPPGSEPIDPTP